MGFVEEKLVLPQSLMHDVETSLAPHLKERIVSYQNYLGQVRLYRPDEVSNAQIGAAFKRFLRDDTAEVLKIENAFLQHPDQRVQQLNVTVDMHLETRDVRSGRMQTAQDLEAFWQRRIRQRTTFEAQLQIEYDAHRDFYLEELSRSLSQPVKDLGEDLIAFANSSQFRNVPIINISARLYASILTKYPTRPIKSSDAADIDILSTYIPYINVFCTDTFMAEQMRTLGLAKAYGVAVFSAKSTSLDELKTLLQSYIQKTAPVRRPAITAFVVPTRGLKEHAFDFFHKLGTSAKEMGAGEYAEIYAFDDGQMPKYEFPQVPGVSVPVYGLQMVQTIKLDTVTNSEQILATCRERCRSDKFVLIDEYKEIPSHFLLGAVMSAESDRETTNGYRIYKKIP